MILITGASGFLGGNMIKSLLKLENNNNFLLLTSKPQLEYKYLIHDNYKFSDNIFINNNYEDITTLIHLGSFIPKIKDQENDLYGANSNIHNTQKLLSANLPKLEKIIYISTIDIYESDNIITENTRINPISMYGMSKLYCERLISTHCSKESIICQILRLGHIYGPGEEQFNKIIPIMLKKCLKGENLVQYGNGEEIRSFIYVADVVDAIIKSIELEQSYGPINIVSDEQVKIKALIKMIVDISGIDLNIDIVKSNHKARDLVFNNKKMTELLIHPQVKLIDGLKMELDYLSNINS